MKSVYWLVGCLVLVYQIALGQIQVLPSTVERGRHVLIQTTGDDIQNVVITASDGYILPIERMTKLTANTAVFMVPYYAPNDTYTIDTNGEIGTLSINSDLGEKALGWFCGYHSGDTGLGAVTIPNCAEPGEEIDGLRDTINIPFAWGNNDPVAFVGGILIAGVQPGTFKFTVPSDTPDLIVPGGINEVFLITQNEIKIALVDILSDVAKDEITVLIDFDETERDPQPFIDRLDLSNFQLSRTPLGGTSSFCANSLFTLTRQNIGTIPELGHVIQTVREQIGVDTSVGTFYIDPVPNHKTCQNTSDDYREVIKLQNGQTIANDFSNDFPVTIAVLDTGFNWTSTSMGEFTNTRVRDYKDFVGNTSTLLTDIFHSPDLNGNMELDINELKNGIIPQIDFLDSSNLRFTMPLQLNSSSAVEPKVNVGHGTGVAILAAGSTQGVANNAEIVPIRVCDETSRCKGTDFIKGICYALGSVHPDQPLVINMSIGGSIPMSALENVIREATANGATIVAASGNIASPDCLSSSCAVPVTISADCSGGDCIAAIPEEIKNVNSLPHYPAALAFRTSTNSSIQGLIAVGATNGDIVDDSSDPSDSLGPKFYSNRGSYITLAAPDDTVLSGADLTGFQAITTTITSVKPILGDGYYHGTSFSTPLVAGTIALMKQVKPNITHAQIYGCINTSTSSPIFPFFPTPTKSDTMAVGLGLLNVEELVNCAIRLP